MSETSTEQAGAESVPETDIDPAQIVPEAIQDASRNYRKVRQGYVVSDKMDKTVVVSVEDRVKHSLYGKVLRRSSRVKAHDEAGDAGVGDLVQIMETRPLSANKRWRLVRILDRAK